MNIVDFDYCRSNFLITASCDGHIKFWKKTNDEGLVFVKHFRTHLGTTSAYIFKVKILVIGNHYDLAQLDKSKLKDQL